MSLLGAGPSGCGAAAVTPSAAVLPARGSPRAVRAPGDERGLCSPAGAGAFVYLPFAGGTAQACHGVERRGQCPRGFPSASSHQQRLFLKTGGAAAVAAPGGPGQRSQRSQRPGCGHSHALQQGPRDLNDARCWGFNLLFVSNLISSGHVCSKVLGHWLSKDLEEKR